MKKYAAPPLHGVRLVPDDGQWPARFRLECIVLREAFAPQPVELHHAGSTAVPGLLAKPVLDVFAGVAALAHAEAATPALEACGYAAHGEYGLPGRRFFTKGTSAVRFVNLHVFESGSAELERHLLFCAYLRAHPERAQAYARLKRELAVKHGVNVNAYADAKSAFVRETEALAQAERTA